MKGSKTAERPVASLSLGAGAQPFAADFTLAAYEVHLCQLPHFAPESLEEVLKTHEMEFPGTQLNFKWLRGEGIAKIDVVTREISGALKATDLVIANMPASGHEPFFQKNDPHMGDEQATSIFLDSSGCPTLSKRIVELVGYKAKS